MTGGPLELAISFLRLKGLHSLPPLPPGGVCLPALEQRGGPAPALETEAESAPVRSSISSAPRQPQNASPDLSPRPAVAGGRRSSRVASGEGAQWPALPSAPLPRQCDPVEASAQVPTRRWLFLLQRRLGHGGGGIRGPLGHLRNVP